MHVMCVVCIIIIMQCIVIPCSGASVEELQRHLSASEAIKAGLQAQVHDMEKQLAAHRQAHNDDLAAMQGVVWADLRTGHDLCLSNGTIIHTMGYRRDLSFNTCSCNDMHLNDMASWRIQSVQRWIVNANGPSTLHNHVAWLIPCEQVSCSRAMIRLRACGGSWK